MQPRRATSGLSDPVETFSPPFLKISITEYLRVYNKLSVNRDRGREGETRGRGNGDMRGRGESENRKQMFALLSLPHRIIDSPTLRLAILRGRVATLPAGPIHALRQLWPAHH